jgi:hypothetical protein
VSGRPAEFSNPKFPAMGEGREVTRVQSTVGRGRGRRSGVSGQGFWSRVQGPGFRVQGSGSRVQGSGSRDYVLGSGV